MPRLAPAKIINEQQKTLEYTQKNKIDKLKGW
jgi:hypothetical protein